MLLQNRNGKNITPFQLTCIIFQIQIGLGVFVLPRSIYLDAGQFSWLSIILAGGFLQIGILLYHFVLKQLDYPLNIFDVFTQIAGRWLSIFASVIFFLVYLLYTAYVMETYLEFIQLWLLPTTPRIILRVIMIGIIFYGATAGHMLIARLSVLFSLIIALLLGFISYGFIAGDWKHLLPLSDFDITGVIKGAISSGYGMSGLESFMIYSFYLSRKSSFLRAVTLSNVITTSFYLIVITAIILYFSPEQIKYLTWPTLNLVKVEQLPFFIRFDFLFVTLYLLVILTGAMNMFYVLNLSVANIFKITDLKKIMPWSLPFIYLLMSIPKHSFEVEEIINYGSYLSIIVTFLFPLSCLILIKVKRMRNNVEN